jgi:hypothetical protein
MTPKGLHDISNGLGDIGINVPKPSIYGTFFPEFGGEKNLKNQKYAIKSSFIADN